MKWFKHFSKMRLDIKIKRLMDKYGIEGYGVYNYVLESISFNLDADKPIPEIEENCIDLAKELKIDTLKLENILKTCIEEGLFEINPVNQRITCMKMLTHLDNTLSANPEIKKILANFKKLQEPSINLKQIRLDKIRLDKIRLDKIRLDISSKEKHMDHVFISKEEWEDLTNNYEEKDIEPKIAYINCEIANKNSKYLHHESHYAIIKKFLVNDVMAGLIKKKPRRIMCPECAKLGIEKDITGKSYCTECERRENNRKYEEGQNAHD
jgi:hypothetical protein